jgi:hypothetical protein
VVAPTVTGFGSTLLKRALASQLGADVEMVFDSDGPKCRITAAEQRLADRNQRPRMDKLNTVAFSIVHLDCTVERYGVGKPDLVLLIEHEVTCTQQTCSWPR